jgi:outer membrane receptor protein involved in Fe transport
MKKLAVLYISTMFTFASFAQFPAANAKGNAAPPQIGHVFGKITDGYGKGINGASVMMMQQKFDSASKKKKDFLLKAITTRANGEFNFEDLPVMGALTLKVSSTGYTTISLPISFQPKLPTGAMPQGAPDPSKGMPDFSAMGNAFEKDLGEVKMKEEIKQLETVVVTASKPLIKMDIDKKVFNVDKNLVSVGGTALDVMRNVPSIQVDIDGNVKLRNAAPQIFVDGRPTTLQLDQIPADAIESVEVITNPSAKFDASGGNAGILNIVLKKNKKSGYNGNVMAGVDRLGGLNGGGSFSFRQNKINVSASVMGNQMRNNSTGYTNRLNFGSDPATSVSQDNFNKTKGGFMFGRLGLDYFITNKTTLSVSAVKVHGQFRPEENIQMQTDSILSSGIVSTYSERITNSSRTFNATGFQMGMKHLFPKQGEELTADINYFAGKNNSDAFYTTNFLDNSKEEITGTQDQKVYGDGLMSFLTIQTDYVKPLKGNLKIETGLRAQLRTTESNNTTYIKGIGEPDYVIIPSASNNFKNSDNVYAAYFSAKNTIKNFGYQIGLRAESSDYHGELTNTGEEFSNSYPISLFPSIFLSQKLKNKQELQLNVTRRVNRPNFFQLIPYVDYTDSLNITQGNPNLKPEFTSSAEASYTKSFKGNHSLLASVYYKYTNNMITRFLKEATNPVTGEKDIINTYINANSGYVTGLELTSINPVAKWWDMTSNVNIYNSKINTENINEFSQDALWSWFGKFNNTFKLPQNYTIQLTADYQSKSNIPVNTGGGGFGPPMSQAQSASQGYIKAFWGMDIAFRKSFMKNNAATITLGITDIFKTRYNRQYSYSPYFIQDFSRIMNPQMVKLNFSYRFGKIDMSLFKRQNMKGQAEGMQGGMQGIQ